MAIQRTKFRAYVKLGARQKSMLKYVRSRGRHNKTRQKEKSHPVNAEIGFRNKNSERGLINGKVPFVVRNMEDISKIKPNHIIVIGNIGMKSKIPIAKALLEKKVEMCTMNIEKFLAKVEKRMNAKKKVQTKPEAKK